MSVRARATARWTQRVEIDPMSEIRCTCGELLTSVEAICERCLPGFGRNSPKRRQITETDLFRAALLDIRGCHVPDQPAHSQADEVTWVMQHVGKLRKIAADALDKAPRWGMPPGDVYEAPRRPGRSIRPRGVGRVADEPRALLVLLDERPTDDDIRSLHEFLRGWEP